MDKEIFSQVPEDFPYPSPNPGAISGFQPKILIQKHGDQYFQPGTSPEDRLARWELCEDLALQFKTKCIETKAGKRSDVPEQEILDQYFQRLQATNWVSKEEAIWIMRRTANLLAWQIPESLRG